MARRSLAFIQSMVRGWGGAARSGARRVGNRPKRALRGKAHPGWMSWFEEGGPKEGVAWKGPAGVDVVVRRRWAQRGGRVERPSRGGCRGSKKVGLKRGSRGKAQPGWMSWFEEGGPKEGVAWKGPAGVDVVVRRRWAQRGRCVERPSRGGCRGSKKVGPKRGSRGKAQPGWMSWFEEGGPKEGVAWKGPAGVDVVVRRRWAQRGRCVERPSRGGCRGSKKVGPKRGSRGKAQPGWMSRFEEGGPKEGVAWKGPAGVPVVVKPNPMDQQNHRSDGIIRVGDWQPNLRLGGQGSHGKAASSNHRAGQRNNQYQPTQKRAHPIKKP
ncbi:hypothetical protein APED_00380 [Acanthopleuribacter pedis]